MKLTLNFNKIIPVKLLVDNYIAEVVNYTVIFS